MLVAEKQNPQLDDVEELLYRQVNPGFIRDGRMSSQAFRPTKKDEFKLSVARSSLTTPQGAFETFTKTRQLPSAGTWAVSIRECTEVKLDAFPDPLDDDQAHAFVDFSGLTNGKIEEKGGKLRDAAVARGPLFVPQPPPA